MEDLKSFRKEFLWTKFIAVKGVIRVFGNHAGFFGRYVLYNALLTSWQSSLVLFPIIHLAVPIFVGINPISSGDTLLIKFEHAHLQCSPKRITWMESISMPHKTTNRSENTRTRILPKLPCTVQYNKEKVIMIRKHALSCKIRLEIENALFNKLWLQLIISTGPHSHKFDTDINHLGCINDI